jgi:protein-disulfide isomerase
VTLARATTRRGALAGVLAFAALGAQARPLPLEPDDMALGSPRAPVTVIEYASVGCPHCAAWNNEVFDKFRAKYVATRKVRFVVRECLTGDADLATAGFLLARCADPSKYFQVIDAVYKAQPRLFDGGADVGATLKDIGHGAGLTDERIEACLGDQAALTALNARSDRHATEDKVDSTPTFVIGATRIDGYASLAQLDAAIAAQLRRRR